MGYILTYWIGNNVTWKIVWNRIQRNPLSYNKERIYVPKKFILLELVQQSMEMALSTCTNWAFISARALSASFRKTHRIVFLDGILIPENPRLTRRINAGSWNCRNDQLHHTIASNSNSCSSSSVAIDFLVKLWISLVPSIICWWTAFLLYALIYFVKLAVLRLFKYRGWAYSVVQPSFLHKTIGILYSLSTASWKGPHVSFFCFSDPMTRFIVRYN